MVSPGTYSVPGVWPRCPGCSPGFPGSCWPAVCSPIPTALVQNNQSQLRFKYKIWAGGSGKNLVSHGNSRGTLSTQRDGDTGGSLTFQVPVEVLEPSHLTISLVPHGFLQGFPLGRCLDEVFVILRDALDLALQLGWRKGQARVRYSWNEERKGRCWPKPSQGAQPNLSCQRSSSAPQVDP